MYFYLINRQPRAVAKVNGRSECTFKLLWLVQLMNISRGKFDPGIVRW